MFDAGLAAAAHGHITQVDTVSDLFRAHYEAHTTVAEAFTDFTVGLGVAEACDGEIVAADDTVWQIRADGIPVIAAPDLGLPFAVVAHGGLAMRENLPAGIDMTSLPTEVDALLNTPQAQAEHLVAAVRVDGTFRDVLLRSEHRQEPPYPPLPDVLSHEVHFTFETWHGSLVGFRFPDTEDGVTIPGLHLHAIAADRLSGGHCHTFTVVDAVLTVWLDDVEVRLPLPG